MIPPLNFDSGCVKCQFEADQTVFFLAEKAVRLVIDMTENAKKPLFFDTILPRALFVAQSIICMIVLPFKMVATFFIGLIATLEYDDAASMIDAGYALASVGVYAAAIPAGFILACQPTSVISEIQKAKRQLSPELFTAALEQSQRMAAIFARRWV